MMVKEHVFDRFVILNTPNQVNLEKFLIKHGVLVKLSQYFFYF